MEMKCPLCSQPVLDASRETAPGPCTTCLRSITELDRRFQHERLLRRRRKPIADVLSRHLRPPRSRS